MDLQAEMLCPYDLYKKPQIGTKVDTSIEKFNDDPFFNLIKEKVDGVSYLNSFY
jgi:hypothetical protein